MFNFLKNKKIKKECYNNIQLELQYTFLNLLKKENRRYRIENCTPEFVSFIQNSGFTYKGSEKVIEILDGDSNRNMVVLKCSVQSFQKRMDFIDKNISDFIE